MKSEGIIKSKNAAQFRTWTVEAGPTEWTTNSVWDEIDGHLTKNGVSAAAAALRRYLEYFAGEASHRLRAARSEEHTSELQSLMRNSYAVFCLKKKKILHQQQKITSNTNT